MSKLAANAYNPLNGSPEDVWEGFSWLCSFFGCFWFLYESLWGWAAISFVVSIATYGLARFKFPVFANEQQPKSLIAKGYLAEDRWKQKQGYTPPASSSERSRFVNSQSAPIADELSKLADLESQGV